MFNPADCDPANLVFQEKPGWKAADKVVSPGIGSHPVEMLFCFQRLINVDSTTLGVPPVGRSILEVWPPASLTPQDSHVHKFNEVVREVF